MTSDEAPLRRGGGMKYALLALLRRRLLWPALALGGLLLLSGCATSAYKGHTQRGDEYLNDMNYPAAEREYREALRLAPDEAPAHRALGNVLELEGKYAAAEAEYREAVRLAPREASSLCCLAYFLDRNGRRKEARPYWEKALKTEKGADGVATIKARLAEPD